MTTITWVIERLDCVPQTPEGADYVVTAYWRCNGVDGDYSGTVYATSGFPVVQDKSFTPYASLTLDQVLGWIYANGVDKDATQAAVEKQIQEQIAPTVQTPPLPWSV